jgi:hypothetical protein
MFAGCFSRLLPTAAICKVGDSENQFLSNRNPLAKYEIFG